MTKLSKVIVVTGGNRGIGWELLRRLGLEYPDSHLYLTARSKKAGLEAVDRLHQREVNARFHVLDVTSANHINNFRNTLSLTHGNSCIDILVNNAGVNLESDTSLSIGERAKRTIDTNYFGVMNVSHMLLPMMKPGGRVLNLTSTLVRLIRRKLGPEIRARMDAIDLSLGDLTKVMTEFVKHAEVGDHAAKGYSDHSYGFSKYAVIRLTHLLAKENKMPGVLINCCCPGWVKTDMGGSKAPLEVEDGVETPLFCVQLPEDSDINGKFLFGKKVIKF